MHAVRVHGFVRNASLKESGEVQRDRSLECKTGRARSAKVFEGACVPASTAGVKRGLSVNTEIELDESEQEEVPAVKMMLVGTLLVTMPPLEAGGGRGGGRRCRGECIMSSSPANLQVCVNLGWQCQMSQMISRGRCNLQAAAADGSVRAMRDSPSHRRSREKSTARGHKNCYAAVTRVI